MTWYLLVRKYLSRWMYRYNQLDLVNDWWKLEFGLSESRLKVQKSTIKCAWMKMWNKESNEDLVEAKGWTNGAKNEVIKDRGRRPWLWEIAER